ncbi:NEW3 domain-containing protein [Streptomyces pathocidini]|uniref:glycoside hydrolase family 38 N-terminal domain-containing protein n=1 Tax=Streptomyces pathocidini TaxID=1650571 RepID=UPI0033F14213
MESGVVITGCESLDRFTGPAGNPLQVVRVAVGRTRPAGPLTVSVEGPGVRTPHPRRTLADSAEAYAGVDAQAELDSAAEGAAEGRTALESVVEVSVHTGGARPGTSLPAAARVTSADGTVLAECAFHVEVAEPGWTVHLVPHFHYDPMWWNTQAAYTAQWDAPLRPGEAQRGWEYTGVPAFTLVPMHLQHARDDPDYRFVLSELDYLKPFWDTHPEHREELRRLIDEGRLEIVGGTYNEPSTNLTCAESTVRSAVHGLGFHRRVVGGNPRTAWQLDVFGHDPAFPALMAGAGLDSAVLARGPHHQWGPMMDTWGAALRPPTAMQLPAEHEWIGPSGDGLLLHYLPAHYSAGWFSQDAESAEAATRELLALYGQLKRGAATRNVLIPMGTDFSWPHQWGLEVQHAWNRRYTWPRLTHSTPADYFAAVRAEFAARGQRPLPSTRDLNPVYTGKDVTYADVKQAHRAAENLLLEAEGFAALASALGAGDYPEAALDKAWRHVLHAAHHDAVTGTFSDQVYLDLLPGWREAHDLAAQVRDRSTRALAGRADTRVPASPEETPVRAVALTVFNSLSWERTDLLRTSADVTALGLQDPAQVALRDETGAVRPVHLDSVERGADGTVVRVDLTAVVRDVPSLGHRTWWLVDGGRSMSGGWTEVPYKVPAVADDRFRLEADPARGGGLSRVTDLRSGRELITPGAVDELVLQDEYAAHPFFEEGPWHLLPKGPGTGSGERPAERVTVEHGPLGRRITATGRTGTVRWTRTSTLWEGLERVELTTRVAEFTGSDQLLRLRLPVNVPGALPVAETAAAVIGRGFAFPEVDAGADHTHAPWTLDSPCLNWFALSATARIAVHGPNGDLLTHRAVGAGEIVLPDAGLPGYGIPATEGARDGLRELVVALVRRGVTTVPTRPDGTRWGDLATDSGLPDFRLAVGGPEANAFTARLLGDAGPAYAEAVRLAQERAERDGTPQLVWVPASRPLREAWQPGADLTGARDLPVAVLAVPGQLADAHLGALASHLASAEAGPVLHTLLPVPGDGPGEAEDAEDRTVGLLVRGTPGFAVDTQGRLHNSLMRSCTGRPAGEWMDPPRRTAPDGSSFQLQHWSHVFEHALVAGGGDWRDAGLVRRGREFNTPLSAVDGPPAPGDLPSRLALLEVADEAGPAARTAVLVEAVKPTGNPSAEFASGGAPRAVRSLSVRLRETDGRTGSVRLRTPLALAGAARADLLEQPGEPLELAPGGEVAVTADGAAYTTVVLGLREVPEAAGELLGQGEEEAQPLFSRYWLHNVGAAPLGGLPVTVVASPGLLHTRVGWAGNADALRVAVTVASGSGQDGAKAHGRLDVRVPEGWGCDRKSAAFQLTPGGHQRYEMALTPAADAEPGDYLVHFTATPDLGAPVHDAVTVVVPERRPAAAPEPPPRVTVDLSPGEVAIAPGATAEVRVRIGNELRSACSGEIFVASPWGSWDILSPRGASFTAGAGESAELRVEVAPPPTAPPGRTWFLVKAVCHGRVFYSPAVSVTVTGDDVTSGEGEGGERGGRG